MRLRKAEKKGRGACIASLKKSKRDYRGCTVYVQQRVPESEWVDEGLNGLEGTLGMWVYTGMIFFLCVCVCYKCNVV